MGERYNEMAIVFRIPVFVKMTARYHWKVPVLFFSACATTSLKITARCVRIVVAFLWTVPVSAPTGTTFTSLLHPGQLTPDKTQPAK